MMPSPFPLDAALGLEFFQSDTEGCGGLLRVLVEDFLVEEIPEPAPAGGGGEFTHCTLTKRNRDTHEALRALSRALGISQGRIGFAGTKDKKALTRQKISVWGVSPHRLESLRLEGIQISGCSPARRRIGLGEAAGNRFVIVIRGIEEGKEETERRIERTHQQLAERGLPNYFGYQRFGVARPNTHLVGRALVRGNLEEAVLQYLTHPTQREAPDAYEARRRLSEEGDFRRALKYFPQRLRYERTLLETLSHRPRDYAGALRRLPRGLSRMFVHAEQSYLFNRILSRLLEEGFSLRGRLLPLFGYKSLFSEGRQGEVERELLEEEGISLEDFRIPSLPELASRGAKRRALLDPLPDLRWEVEEDGLHPRKRLSRLEFALPMGSYATVLLREFMKTDPARY
jgi:tRNA pseudouridine13 synthase